MNDTWKTYGHEQIKGMLERQMACGRVPQAFVWSGPQGAGKHALALEFAARLAGPQAGGVLQFSFDGADVEAVRGWVRQLGLRPGGGNCQVAVFDRAELITAAQSNVLLKPLEEPAAGTYAIFVTSRLSLPATVLSRCQVVHFGRPRYSALPSSDQNSSERQKAWRAEWKELLAGPLFARLRLAGQLAQEETPGLQDRLEFWLAECARPGQQDPARRLAVLLEAWKRLGMHANKKMVLEYVCLHL